MNMNLSSNKTLKNQIWYSFLFTYLHQSKYISVNNNLILCYVSGSFPCTTQLRRSWIEQIHCELFYLSKIPSYLVQRIIISSHCSTILWLQQKYKGITNRIMTLVVVGPCKVKIEKVFYYLPSYYFQILVSIIRLCIMF